MLDYTRRRIILELLSSNTGYAHLAHEIHRMAHYYNEGLTPKEVEFLDQRCAVLKEEMAKMAKFKDRLKGSL